MIHQTSETDKLEIEAGKRFFNALAILEIPKLLKQSNIRKDSRRLNGEKDKERRSAYTVFVFLIITDHNNVPEQVDEYIRFFNEERPAYTLGYLTPKQYREQFTMSH